MSKFQEYLPIYEGDRFCLMCGQACPVRRVTKNEATSPHGWALLVSSVQRGMLQWNAETVDVLYQCADCGLCQANCATDRPLPVALMAAREFVVNAGHAPASVQVVKEKLREWGNPYGETADDGRGTVSSNQLSVAFFIGDATYFLKPEIISAVEKILRAMGVNATHFGEGRSSGYLPYTLGLWDTARTLAEQTRAEIEKMGAREIITLSSTDAHALQHIYPELGVPLAENVRAVELVDFLAQQLANGNLKIRARETKAYTYHDATHSVRLNGRAKNARALLHAVMGNPPREMLFREHLATPLGSGGLEFTQPALAEKLVRTRIAEAKATGAEILVTDDPLDTAMLEKYAEGIQVKNLYQMIAEQLR